MGNILDYLDWRGDLTFEQSPFNEVDNLILACFSYLDLDEMAEVKNGNTLSVEELFAAFSRQEMKKDLKAESAFLQNTPVLLEKMACAERFRKCTVGGFVNEILSSQAQQFAAVTIGLDDGTTYISFRGTDDTIVGWKEDFNLSNGVVPSHRKALGYLETHGTYIQSMLRIGGHSKGGNLAMYAAMQCSDILQEKLLSVYGGFYYLTPEQKKEKTHGLIEKHPFAFPWFASDIGAYAAFLTKDKTLAETVWKNLLNALIKIGDEAGFTPVCYATDDQKKAHMEIPWIKTNFAAQWGLNTITTLELLRNELPDTMDDVRKLIEEMPGNEFHRA